jgi:hypothetical protein
VITPPTFEGVKFDATVGLNDEALLLSAGSSKTSLAAIAAAIQERCERRSPEQLLAKA